MKRPALLVATAVLALGGLSACSGDGESGGPATSFPPPVRPTGLQTLAPTPTAAPTVPSPPAVGLSKAEFLTQGNAICAVGNAKIEKAAMSVAPNSQADIAFVTKTFIAPAVTEQINALRGLGIPDADKATVEAVLVQAEAVVEQIGVLDAADIDPDRMFAGVNAKLVAYGLTTCGAS